MLGVPYVRLRKAYCLCKSSEKLVSRGPIYKISYDWSYDYLKFIVRSTYDSDLQHAKISLTNVLSKYIRKLSPTILRFCK